MRTDVLTGPAPWAVDRLGSTAAAQLWMGIPTALATAVARVVKSPDVSPAVRRQALADERWPVPYEELCAHLHTVDGARLAAAARLPHPVVVVRDLVLLPWCYGPTGAISMRDAHPDRSLGRLAGEVLHRLSGPADGSGRGPGVLIAGYACTVEHGLLRVCLGAANVAPDGQLAWQQVTDLPLPPPTIPRPRRQCFP